MRIVDHSRPGRLAWSFEPGPGEPHPQDNAPSVTFAGGLVFVEDADIDVDHVHPDLLGLAAFSMLMPFVDTIEMPTGVSEPFARAVQERSGLGLGPVDPHLSPRSAREDGVVALCFSGGQDSFAALGLLPDSTICVYAQRAARDGTTNWQGRFRIDGAVQACEHLASSGRDVRRVRTSIEFLRDPVGFPSHLANAVPIMLLADRLAVRAVATGDIFERMFDIGFGAYRPWKGRPLERVHAALSDAAGLPHAPPTLATSEIITARIVEDLGFADVARSCVRGGSEGPCNDCWKCFRKTMVQMAVTGEWLDHDALDRLFATSGLHVHLRERPMTMAPGIMWALRRYPGDHPAMLRLAEHLEVADVDVEWLARWYPPGLEQLPSWLAADVERRLLRHARPMTDDEQARVRSWDRTWEATSEHRARQTSALIEDLESLART